ncbi:MFS transporter [Myroides phaeus]|uniref:MFS transporter, FSR family, fosmidomycin resistance protein n=1 Tax=Myroides phaeus TaxID=702745 RepID=A0A1G8ER67_9FLAO|nr:MFS transporter [Myroides phaeus]MEC4116603.1 MFS transporter [Myroides phaeus]SDH72356.1 MFS transporter, FSR family, fosmidomycin resistance protein [Myroides phaeus]
MINFIGFQKKWLDKVGQQSLAQKTVYPILLAISFGHLCNDLLQAVVPAVYPMLKENYKLSFAQIGMITFCYQVSSSLLQPLVGNYTDKHPQPYSQMYGMICTMLGVMLLSFAPSYAIVLCSVVLIGIGSSIFHPESSRVSFVASGGKRSLAQSIFQIGGNTGTALAPLLVAWIVLPKGQQHLLWFVFVALVAQFVYYFIGTWYKGILSNPVHKKKKVIRIPELSKFRVNSAIAVLLLLIFSKYFYVASISSYFQFFTMEKFGVSEVQAQVYLFYFLIAVAAGTLIGGFFGDRVGRKYIIWFSVLGAAPFTLLLPYVDLFWTGILIVIIGLIMSSAFPSILVYAQELLPKKIGMVSGLFFGFAFGMGGLGSAILGVWADKTSIEHIYHICAFLPLIGIIAAFLPNMKKVKFREEV